MRLKAVGAALTEVPKAWGNALRFTLPGTPRQWTLTPQMNLENSRPDFVLECNDTSIPTVAIFTDGRAFHAVPARNRLTDDAEKREILRGTGRIVLAVTALDVADAERKATRDPSWFDPQMVTKLIKRPGPRGGRIGTAVLRERDPLGYEHLRRHDLPHTGLTWIAGAGAEPRCGRVGLPPWSRLRVGILDGDRGGDDRALLVRARLDGQL